MQVTVVCFGAMREFLPSEATGNSITLEVDDDQDVGGLVDRLGAPRRLVYALLVNEDPSSLNRPLRDGDKVTLMPQFTGGCRR
jgi:molybdopterin converting factor small subunit